MTNQGLFNTVATHLLTQGEKSEKGGGCCYRTPSGLKCAIGILIPDAKYTPNLEHAICSEPHVMMAAGLTDANFPLARRLQMIHDGYHPSDWRTRLKSLAREFNLSNTVLETVPTQGHAQT